MDETVVGAAPARWMTAGMKREDGMQGSRSTAVDERGRSLVMADGVGVSAPAWWRTTTMDGVADEGGCGGEGVLAPTEYEWGNGGREEGEPCLQGALVSNARKFTNLAPVSNFLHHSNISRLGIGR